MGLVKALDPVYSRSEREIEVVSRSLVSTFEQFVKLNRKVPQELLATLAFKLGIQGKTINSFLTPEELAYIVNNSESKALIVSAAKRAVRTWEAVSTGAGWDVEPDVDRALYHADPDSALDLVRLVEPDAATVVVVGHNPTVASLAQLLDDGDGDPVAGVAMAGGFPAGSVAVFRFSGAWSDLGWATAELLAFHTP